MGPSHLRHHLRTLRISWPVTVSELKAKKAESVFLLVALVLFVGARFWHITATPLMFDEMFSVHTARQDWSGLIDLVRQDLVHPPLFYMLLKIWIWIGGESLHWLRLFGTLIAIVSIFPILGICRELEIRLNERNAALVLIAVNGTLILYSRFVRMYSLFFFLTLCSLYYFVKLLKSPDAKPTLVAALFGTNLVLIYTHYFAWFLIGVELLCLIGAALFDLLNSRKKKLQYFLLCLLGLAISFIPWVIQIAPVFLSRGLSQNISWAQRPYLNSLIAFYSDLSGNPFQFPRSAPLGLFLFGFPILVWAASSLLMVPGKGEREPRTIGLLLVFAFLPVAFVYLFSRLLPQSIWLPRGLLFVAVPFLILVGVTVTRLRPRWLSFSITLILFFWASLAGLQTLTTGFGQFSMESWVDRMIESSGGNGVRVYTLDENTPYIIWFHLSNKNVSGVQIIQVKSVKNPRLDYWLPDKMFPSVATDELTTLDGDHFWITFRDQQWHESRTPQQIFKDAGYRVGEVFSGGPLHSRTHLFPVWRQPRRES